MSKQKDNETFDYRYLDALSDSLKSNEKINYTWYQLAIAQNDDINDATRNAAYRRLLWHMQEQFKITTKLW